MGEVCLGVAVAGVETFDRDGDSYLGYIKGRLSWRPLSCSVNLSPLGPTGDIREMKEAAN
jgi:hypothetical protein